MGFDDIQRRWESCRTDEGHRVLWKWLTGPNGSWITNCKDLVKERDEQTLKKWLNNKDKQDFIHLVCQQGGKAMGTNLFGGKDATKLMRTHLLCALAACNPHWPTGTVPDDALHPAAEETGLALGFLRDLAQKILCRQPRPANKEVRAPFLLVVHGKAMLGWFAFERLPEGQGDVFLEPEQAFLAMDAKFSRVFSDVPTVVGRLLDSQGVDFRPYDVRIQVEWPEGRPCNNEIESQTIAIPLSGDSVTGAAAWGLYFTWTGKVPDPEIIVMAHLNNDGSLSGVESVKEKTKAVADDGRFDTIVVANDADRCNAEDALRESGKLGPIRVVSLDASKS